MDAVALILLTNTLAAGLYFVLNLKRPERLLALFFLILPGLGFAIYFIPMFWFRITQHHNLYDESNVRLNLQQEDFTHAPDVAVEINEVSFHEAATVASSQEKRALLMGILRHDLMQSPELLQSALADDDTETAHYAASASLEINRRLKNTVQDYETHHYADPANLEMLRNLLDAMAKLLEYALLTEREHYFYCSKQNDLYQQLEKLGPEFVTESDLISWCEALLAIQRPHEALAKAVSGNQRHPSETTWLNRLKLTYQLRDRDAFEAAMAEFLQARLVVSERGLNLIRFWKERTL
ncbi:MAG: hypothetical protein PHQ83_04620 [Eubacteriales bacterium]|nr:hypothetical protein [Eubacteriales bacterium]